MRTSVSPERGRKESATLTSMASHFHTSNTLTQLLLWQTGQATLRPRKTNDVVSLSSRCLRQVVSLSKHSKSQVTASFSAETISQIFYGTVNDSDLDSLRSGQAQFLI